MSSDSKISLLKNPKCTSTRPKQNATDYYETYAERAEKLNGRTAMLGFVAAVISYATTGSVFFFGIFGF